MPGKTDNNKVEEMLVFLSEYSRLCDELKRDVEVRKGLMREWFRLIRFEMTAGERTHDFIPEKKKTKTMEHPL